MLIRKAKDKIKWYGALASLQRQNKLLVHVGGPTAIAILGASHYLRLSSKERVFLFSESDTYLPQWFYKTFVEFTDKAYQNIFFGFQVGYKFL